MTVPELLGFLLAIVGLAFAFETPRKWFLRGLRLHRDEPPCAAAEPQQLPQSIETRPRRTEKPKSPLAPIPSSNISVKEIIDAVNGAPPFQRDTVAAHYVEIPVKWEGFLRDVIQDPRDKSLVMVNLITDKSKIVSYSIWFSEQPEKIPEIKTLQRDSKILVVGTIQSVSGPGVCVTVHPDSIEVLERAA